MKVKCTVQMKDKVLPAVGSAKGEPGKATGVCPECETPGVMLSVVGGFVRAHVIAETVVVENNPHASAVVVVADKDVRDVPVKCMIDGEPLTVKDHHVLPVAGSVREAVAGEFQGGMIKNPDRTGSCPECGAHVALSGKGFVTSHNALNGPSVASASLVEPSVVPADMGARVGDPSAGLQRRTVELDGAFEHGTVRVPVPGKNGRTKLEDAPATEANVRVALDYVRGRRPRSDAGRAEQSARVSELVRRLEAMRSASVVVHADVDAPVTVDVATVLAPAETSMSASVSPDGLTAPAGRGMIAGAPVVKGRPMVPFAGEVTVRQQGEAYVRPQDAMDNRSAWEQRAGTMAGPLGRDRLDRVAAMVVVPGPELSRSQKRRMRRKRCQEAYVQRALAGEVS